VTTAIVTGSAGLIGSEAVRRLLARGHRVVGIDNDMRRAFFGDDASTLPVRAELVSLEGYTHCDLDVRDAAGIERVFAEHGTDVDLVVHAAAQPSHDWAAGDPKTDFSINAGATLELLEATRSHAPEASFVFLSTNKVYGDTPNRLPLEEHERRLELARDHPFYAGIDESMSIDHTTHSLFGVSKSAADLLVQEYGRYFGMKTACLRAGCLTGPAHAGTRLHGFLSYLMRCTVRGEPYTVYGYGGKQVRDNIHSHDLISAVIAFYEAPRSGEVYNIGGGRENSCSVLEAIELCQRSAGRELAWTYEDQSRIGDHRWWISDCSRFSAHYPAWKREYDLERTLDEIRAACETGAPA
jgi:CDP-paratose 2-epimerase